MYVPYNEGAKRNPTRVWREAFFSANVKGSSAVHLCGSQAFNELLTGTLPTDILCADRLQLNVNARRSAPHFTKGLVMSTLPKRRLGPGPVVAPAVDIAALHAYLRANSSGLTWTNLALRFQRSASIAAIALAGALDKGLVRVDYSGEYVLYHAAEHLALPEAPNDAVDAVVSFIAAHEDDERGSPDVMLALDKVIAGLAPRFSAQQVFAAVEVLCKEALVWFHVIPSGLGSGLLNVTLSRVQYHTVVAYDTDAHQPLCFHVRSGTKEIALQKVNTSAYGSSELCLMGVTPGYIEFSEIAGHGSMLIEKL